MKTLITLSIFLFICMGIQAQTDILIKTKNNTKVVDIDTLTGIKNKTLRCESDTLYLINPYGIKAFYKCIDDLSKVKNLSSSLDNLSLNLNSINSNVNTMFNNMGEVNSFIKKYSAETEKNLLSLESNNAILSKNLTEVNQKMAELQANLKAQQMKNLGTNLMWGAGGITVGGLIVAALMLVK